MRNDLLKPTNGFSRSSRHAKELIARLDEGLAEMHRTGEWYKIVSAYISDYNASIAGQ